MINEMVFDENNVAMIPSLGISYQLNETAKKIIELIKEGNSKDEIVQILANEENADAKQVYIDVNDFFAKLKIYGLLQ